MFRNYKSFTSFEKAISEIKEVIPTITEYIGDLETPDEIKKCLLEKVSKSVPTTSDPDYPCTYGITVNAMGMSFKTKGFYSFGWKQHTNKATGESSYDFNVIIRSRFRDEHLFKEKGWSQVPFVSKNRRKTFFNGSKPSVEACSCESFAEIEDSDGTLFNKAKHSVETCE